MDSISVLCIVALILWIFTIGFAVWCSFKFGQHWNELIFVKRRKLLTLALLIQYLVVFVTIPVVIVFTLLFRTNPNSESTKALRVAHFFAHTFLMVPAFTIIQYLYVTRVWLLYYDMLLSKIQKNREWRMIIDPKVSNIIDSESKFALNNQNTLYKTKALLKICGIGFLIEYIIIGYPLMFILNATSNRGSILDSNNQGSFFINPYMTLMYFIRFCFGYYIWRKMNKLKMIDNFGIRKEIHHVIIQVTCGIIIFIVSVLINAVVAGVYGLINDNVNEAISQLTSIYFTIIFGCANIYVMFIYPIKVYDKFSNDKNNNKGVNDAENKKYIESISHWTQIMNTEIGYEEFMDYLAREFSTENLLFITEYIEVKKVLMDYFPHILDKLKQEHGSECGFFVEFATLTSDEYKSLETRANGTYTITDTVKKFSGGFGSQLASVSTTADASNIDENPDSTLASENHFIQSLIGRQLANQLFKLTTISVPSVSGDHDHDHNHGDGVGINCNYYSKENIIAVGDCIVSAFSCIYSKYVDDYDASFMINISHRNRQALLKLFNCNYYDRWQKSLKNSLNSADGSSNKSMVKKDASQYMNRMAMVNYLLRNEIENANDSTLNNNKDEFDKQIECLLKLLIESMEKAVKEVSNLMQDSFFRFRRDKKHLFKYMTKSSSATLNA